MAETIDLVTWPSCAFNLCWSPENIIAVALAETVALLVPRLRPSESAKHWTTIELPTAVYPEHQVPFSNLRSWRTFQIGEELSDRHVAALDWSPASVGKHHSSLLAVLTSNLALSLWECVGRPEILSDWRRAIVINSVLTPAGLDSQTLSESLQRSWRIRCYCWAPALTSGQLVLTRAAQFMAIAKDDGSVIIVKLVSPHFTSDPDWQLECVHTFESFNPTSSIPVSQLLPPGSVAHRPPFIDQLTWSPWSVQDDGARYKSRLVFASHDTLYCTTVVYHGERKQLEVFKPVPFLTDITDLGIAGPVRWATDLGPEHQLTLVVSQPSRISIVVFDHDFGSVSVADTSMDNHSDIITGLTFHHSQTMSLSRMRSTCHPTHPDFVVSLGHGSDKSQSAWRQYLMDTEASMGVKMRIPGQFTTKVYGLASSPTLNLTAVATSCHPAELLEYIIDAKKLTHVALVRSSALSQVHVLPRDGMSPLLSMSAESLMIELLHFSTSESEKPFNLSSLLRDRVPPTKLDPRLLQMHAEQAYAGLSDPTTILSRLTERLRSEPTFLRYRHECLLKRASVEAAEEIPTDLNQVRMHAFEVLALPSFLCRGRRDQSIKDNARHVAAEIDRRFRDTGDTSPIPDTPPEVCPNCSSDIFFESLKWARCSRGHHFSRCGLTFLAISSQQVSKSCSICDYTYIHSSLARDEHEWEQDDRAEPNDSELSLSGVLQHACMTCIYCGGRFIG